MCNLFADDTDIYVSGKTVNEVKSKLQVAVNATINWFHTNKLTINPDKSFTMLVCSSKNPMKNAKLEIIVHNAILEQVDNFKYLGVTIDKNLTWSEHISAMCTKLAKSLGALKHLSQFLPSQLLNKLYQSNIQSIIDYCCTVWGHSGQETYLNYKSIKIGQPVLFVNIMTMTFMALTLLDTLVGIL